MASSTDRRILNLPLITSGNVVGNIVLPLDDPNDGITKKINLDLIKTYTLSGSVDNNYYTTGSTLINGIAYFDRNDQLSAYTLNLTSLTGDANTFLTAATYNDLTNTITLTNNNGVNFNIYIDAVSGLTVNGVLSATTISGGTLYGDGSNLTGISTQDTFVTGFTYQDNTFTISDNTDSTYNANFNSVTGLTINGNLNVTGDTTLNGMTANTFSSSTINVDTITATDYVGLGFPDDETIESVGDFVRIKDIVTSPSGGTRTFQGNIIVTSGLTANTISATTYQNLPTDVRVTGGTYSVGTITFTNNTGGTFNVTGLTTGSTSTISGDYLPLSGGTVSGSTTFTNGLTANTISATTYQNLPSVIQISCSDEVTALITGTTTTFRMPYNMLLTEVRGSLTTAQVSGSTFTVNVLSGGTTILSTLLTINNNQKTSKALGTTQPVISTPNLVDDSEISVSITQIGNGTARGLKITLIGNRLN